MKYTTVFALLASLALPSGLRAQYRWHIVLNDRRDTLYQSPPRLDTICRAPTSISCNGENCIATEVIWSMNPPVGDSNVILSSHDGGLSWSVVANDIPNWRYIPDTNTVEGYGKQGLYFDVSQQIDSLNAIVADKYLGEVIITHDGWKTWHVDSSFNDGILSLQFANAAEGMLRADDDFYWTTVDSGNHWKLEEFNPYYSIGVACQSDGDSMFRIYERGSGTSSDTIFTTHNNWNSWDTTYTAYNGPLADINFHPQLYDFGAGDTIAIEGLRWDPAELRYSSAVAISTDLGAHWEELAVPKDNGIEFWGWSFDLHHMIVAGQDSLGRILRSFDGGAHWECDTVLLSNGVPYVLIHPIAVTGSGRVLAGIVDDSNIIGSTSLAYLEQVSSAVSTTAPVQSDFAVFPNPATREIRFTSSARNISITDPLGRSYKVAQTANTLDISALPPGVYFVSDGRSRAKFVKE